MVILLSTYTSMDANMFNFRVNDYALTTRILEIVKMKCGDKKGQDAIWPYMIQV